MKKYILLKDFGTQKEGSVIFIHEHQVEHFESQELIATKKRKTKTKAKIKAMDLTENNNIIKE